MEVFARKYDDAFNRRDVAALDRCSRTTTCRSIRTENPTPSSVPDARSGDLKLRDRAHGRFEVEDLGEIAITTGRWTEKGTPFRGTLQDSVVYQRINGPWKVIGDRIDYH